MANDLNTRPEVFSQEATDFLHVYRVADTTTASKKISPASLVATQSVPGFASTSDKQIIDGVTTAFTIDKTAALADANLAFSYEGDNNPGGNPSGHSFLIDIDATVNFAIGTTIVILNNSTNSTMLATGAVNSGTTTINYADGLRTIKSGGTVTFKKTAADTWNATGDFDFIPTELVDLGGSWDATDTSSIVTAGGAPITEGVSVDKINDLSPNARTFNSTVAAERPELALSGINGIPSLRFPNRFDRLIATGYTIGGGGLPQITVMSISQRNVNLATSVQSIWGGFGDTPQRRALVYKWGVNTNGGVLAPSIKGFSAGNLGDVGTPHKVMVRLDNGATNGSNAHVNGVLSFTFTDTSSGSGNDFTINRLSPAHGGGTEQFISELIVVESYLNDLYQLAFDEYALIKYGITG